MRRLPILLTLAAALLCYVTPAAAGPATNNGSTPSAHAHHASTPAKKTTPKPAAKKAKPVRPAAAKPAPKPRHAAQPAKFKPAATKKQPAKHGSTARVRPAAKK